MVTNIFSTKRKSSSTYINRRVSWEEKNGVVAAYLNFNFYFFKLRAAALLKKLVNGPKKIRVNEFPKKFIMMLKQKGIIYVRHQRL